jgi:hypothetical protein
MIERLRRDLEANLVGIVVILDLLDRLMTAARGGAMAHEVVNP